MMMIFLPTTEETDRRILHCRLKRQTRKWSFQIELLKVCSSILFSFLNHKDYFETGLFLGSVPLVAASIKSQPESLGNVASRLSSSSRGSGAASRREQFPRTSCNYFGVSEASRPINTSPSSFLKLARSFLWADSLRSFFIARKNRIVKNT